MNILPKKRWHVRTKDNIARVRRDEANAAKEESERKSRSRKAETEAQIQFLRNQAKKKYNENVTDGDSSQTSVKKVENINFFSDLEKGNIDYKKTNFENEKEKRDEKEKYEKQIGYLTYLGQDTNEKTGKISWYNEPRKSYESTSEKKIENDKKRKSFEDPIHSMKKYQKILDSSSKHNEPNVSLRKNEEGKHKFHDIDIKQNNFNKNMKTENKSSSKSSNSESRTSIEKLRAERLLREQKEKLRTEKLLAKLQGYCEPVEDIKPKLFQTYNSQYFPELAKQNVKKKTINRKL